MNQITYTLIRSARKTIGLEIRPDGSILVRAPYRLSREKVELFVRQHADWIYKHRQQVLQKQEERKSEPVDRLTRTQLEELAARALEVIPKRVAYYAPLVGVTYGRITIRNQKTRWGSCSAKGNLNFNCLLMLASPEVLDSVVVHELCHRLEMNHSPRFYEQVRRVFPEYDRWNKWLKQNGGALIRRMTG